MIFRFATPWMFALIPVILVTGFLLFRRRHRFDVRVSLPAAGELLSLGRSPWVKLEKWLPVVRVLALILVVGALARPQSGSTRETVTTLGVDIVVAMDISQSMLAEDFQPLNRLEVARRTVGEFIRGRGADRIGLVVFATQAATRGPLTTDHDMLLGLLEDVEVAPRDRSSTAMGMGLATAVNRLRSSDARSRVAVLITDGRNNAGQISPETAAHTAAALGMRVYTIGVGTEGEVPITLDTAMGRRVVYQRFDLDEEILQFIAETTDGRYFRVTDAEGLKQTFETIDRLEKVEIESAVRVLYAELFPLFIYPAAFLLLFELLLGTTRLRRLP
jgi:Ca-activated chloride channel family protein